MYYTMLFVDQAILSPVPQDCVLKMKKNQSDNRASLPKVVNCRRYNRWRALEIYVKTETTQNLGRRCR